MDSTQTIIISGLVSTTIAIIGGFLTYFSTKKLDIQQRTMEKRKELYTKIANHLAFFITTVSIEDTSNAMPALLDYFRETQIWGSDEVVKNYTELLKLMNEDFHSKEQERNSCYKNLIIAMRQDILGETELTEREIDIRGVIKK